MASNTYKMPRVSLGMVLWRHSPHDKEAVPAVVTQVGDRSISCTIWPVNNRGGIPIDGVMHSSDPEWAERPGNDAGVWDYLPEHVALKARIEALEA
jgi:hypothetical protein